MVKKNANYWAKKSAKSGGKLSRAIGSARSNPSVGSVALAAWQGVKHLRSLVNAEKHFKDISGSGTIVYATGTVMDFTQIAQGDDFSQRTGNSILINNVTSRIILTKNNSATDTLIRLILVKDTQQIADTAVVASDILETVSPLSPLKRSSLGRYKVLQSKSVLLHADRTSVKLTIFKHFTRHHFRYNGVNVGDINKGGIYLIAVHNEATNLPTITYNQTTSFYDN